MNQNKNIAFIDIEANQFFKQKEQKTDHLILEYSVFSIDQEEILCFNECHCDHPLNNRLSQLLSKNCHYYQRIKKTEKEAYKELIKISKKYNIFCYGSYDQIILDSAAERYGLEKIKLINYTDIINELFDLPESWCVSLIQLKKLMEINFDNEKEHNSFWDAKILKYVYLKIQEVKDFESYKKYLSIERLRPKYFESSRYKKNIFVELPSNYKIYVLENKKYGYPESNIKDLEIKISIYDQKFNLLNFESVIIQDCNSQNGKVEFNQFKNIFLKKHKDFHRNLMICDGKLWAKFLKKDSNNFYSPYRVSLKLFNSIPITDLEKVKIIRSFYKNGKFDMDIDYIDTVNKCKEFK